MKYGQRINNICVVIAYPKLMKNGLIFMTAISPVRDMKIKMAQKLVRQAVEIYAEEARGNGMSVSDYFDLKQALESIDELILRYTEGDDE
jgi:uncharacterized protein (DUF302 family)